MKASVLNCYLEMGIYTSHFGGVRKHNAVTSYKSLYSAADDPTFSVPHYLLRNVKAIANLFVN